MDPNADSKIEKALRDGTLRPYHKYTDLVKVVLFCLTRFFCLRGGTELCQALVEHFRVGSYLEGPDTGLKKIEYINECYKHRYLTLGRCYLSNKGYPEIREMREDCILHPFRFTNDFLNLKRTTGSGRLFVRATKDTEILTNHQCQSGLRPVLTKSHYGVHKIREFWKELVHDCGFIMPERNKPHGGRSLATTTMISQNLPTQLVTKQMRHASEATLKSYVRVHPTSNAIIQNALDPKLPHVVPTSDENPTLSYYPTPFEETAAPTVMKKPEPVPSSPTTRYANKPAVSSMAKLEDTQDEKSLMLTIMRQQQQMLASMKDDIDRMNEERNKSTCTLL